MSWNIVKLDTIFDIARGGSPRPINDYLTEDIDGINWIMIGDTESDQKYINSTAKKIKKEGVSRSRAVHKGDFLLTNSMSFGRPYILNIDGCIHDGWLVLSPINENISKDYFYFYLGSNEIKSRLASMAAGAVVKNLNKDIVKSLNIPLPPLEEQKKIAAILDAADEYRQKTKALIDKYDQLTQSLFLDMFGDPVTNPKKLPTIELGEACDFYSGKAWKKQELGSKGIKLIRISNLHKPNFPYWFYEGEILERYKVKSGDLLFSWAGVQASIDVYLYKGDTGMLNQHIYNLKPKTGIEKLFLFQLLQLNLNALRSSLGGGVGQFHLKKKDITSIKVLMPQSSDMQLYLKKVDSLNKQKQQAEASLVKAEELFNSLLQKAFKGELTN